MKTTAKQIVGSDVGDQSKLRPWTPLRDLDEFLDFLAQLEALFGPIERLWQPTAGDRFLL